jgi:DNA-binding HxlR family transcriptional regulator
MAGSHQQFCPIARAADILCQRWTPLILRDLHSGCTRFNELRRGVPRMSPTLLSQRLKMLEKFGLVRRKGRGQATSYELTRAGRETGPLLLALGIWGRRWMQHKVARGELDEAFLIYAIEVSIDRDLLDPRSVVEIVFTDRPRLRWPRWWLIVEAGEVQSCFDDPGHDVDVVIRSDLKTLTDLWRGADVAQTAIAQRRLVLDGERRLVDSFERWFRGSVFNAVDLPPQRADIPSLLKDMMRRSS